MKNKLIAIKCLKQSLEHSEWLLLLSNLFNFVEVNVYLFIQPFFSQNCTQISFIFVALNVLWGTLSKIQKNLECNYSNSFYDPVYDLCDYFSNNSKWNDNKIKFLWIFSLMPHILKVNYQILWKILLKYEYLLKFNIFC